MMYNYEEAMREDIMNYIHENFTAEQLRERTPEELEADLEDELWICDSVTGNASGSYTFCTATAKEYVCDNIDLLRNAYADFCENVGNAFLNEAWEGMDVTIRCYLLPRVLPEVIEEVYDDLYCQDNDC